MSAYVQLTIQKRQARERGISPYGPDTIIPLEELFTDKYDLDHIVPKVKSLKQAMQILCFVARN